MNGLSHSGFSRDEKILQKSASNFFGFFSFLIQIVLSSCFFSESFSSFLLSISLSLLNALLKALKLLAI